MPFYVPDRGCGMPDGGCGMRDAGAVHELNAIEEWREVEQET